MMAAGDCPRLGGLPPEIKLGRGSQKLAQYSTHGLTVLFEKLNPFLFSVICIVVFLGERCINFTTVFFKCSITKHHVL